MLLTAALVVGLLIPVEQYAEWGRTLQIDRAFNRLDKFLVTLTQFLGPNHARVRIRSFELGLTVMRLYLAAVILVGMGWYCFALRKFAAEKQSGTPAEGDPNLERLGLALGLLAGLGLSLEYGIKGWFNTYGYDERVWDLRLQHALAPVYLLIVLGIAVWVLVWPLPRNFRGNFFPHAAAAMWLVLLVQNAIAQAITGPLSDWNERLQHLLRSAVRFYRCNGCSLPAGQKASRVALLRNWLSGICAVYWRGLGILVYRPSANSRMVARR